MKRTLWAGVALLALAGSAFALRVAIFPLPQRAAQAEVVVAGKVASIEEKTVKAERFPGDKEGADFKIAVVKIDEVFIGPKGLPTIKIGFLAPVAAPKLDPKQPIRPIRPRPGFQTPAPSVGQEAIFFLSKGSLNNDFYVISGFQGLVDRQSPEYKTGADELRKIGKVLADPIASLKAKDAGERFQAASALLSRYRMQRPGQGHEEAIPAEESKLILLALADADWTVRMTRLGEMNPQAAFSLLRLQPKDGWVQPTDFREVPEAAKTWLKANAGSFKVSRFVAGAADR